MDSYRIDPLRTIAKGSPSVKLRRPEMLGGGQKREEIGRIFRQPPN